tara:strand:+ start:4667 stop:5488 length:822 start_codon:yes stop_codon:yes gene_type:complete
MQNNIIKAVDFKPEMVRITDPRLNKDKKLTAAILNAETGSPLYIETAAMNSPYGLSCYEGSYSIVLKDETSDPDSVTANKNLFQSFKTVNDMTIDYVMKHSKMIMKKELNESQRIIAETQFNACVSQDKNGVDQIKLKVQKKRDDDMPDMLVFKNSSEPIDLSKDKSISVESSWEYLSELLPRNGSLKCIMQPRIYFVNGKTGVNFRVFQVLVPNVIKVSRPDTVFGFSCTPDEKPVIEQSVTKTEDEDVLTDDVEEEMVEDLEDTEESESVA